jgi:2-haloacid dehalogenase
MLQMPTSTHSSTRPATIKAVLFDTFGTTVDWLSSMTAFGIVLGRKRGIDADWEGLVREWRAHYKPAIKPVREGKRPWAGFDTLHREELDKIVRKFGAQKLSDKDRAIFTLGWHHLRPWPDVVPALHRIAGTFIMGPLSNGTTRQMIDLEKWSGLPWNVVFGADMFRTYKPAARMYTGACALLGLLPEQVLMVAAHNEDLHHAAAQGMKTCFVYRPTEDAEPAEHFDYVVDDFKQLAGALGAFAT